LVPGPAASGARVRALWLEGQTDAAADLLVGTDWAKEPSAAAAAISALKEDDFKALAPAQQQARQQAMMKGAGAVRDLSRFVIERARARAADGGLDAAERDLEGLYRYAAALCADPGLAKLTLQVGASVRRAALQELVSLHEKNGNQEKLAGARQRLDRTTGAK
jgi:hypothetical protein